MKTLEPLNTEIEAATTERRTVSVLLREDLAAADRILRLAQTAGVGIRTWSVAHVDRTDRLRLNIAPACTAERLAECLTGQADVISIDILEERDSMGFAMLRVTAKGNDQDEACSLVGAAGGRLLAMDEEGFIAQVSGRAGRVEVLLESLGGSAEVEVIRVPLLGIPK